MPAPWPDEQRSELLTQFVFFPFRITEANNAPDGIAQIDLTLNHVGPRRRIRILEIRHKHFRTGVEGVNHHLAISRPGDLDATVAQVSRDRSTGPIAIANVFRFDEKIERLACIQPDLTLLPAL